MPPAQFIPIAEECGVIVRIGRWVLREACLQARAWQEAGLPPIRIAINISTAELRTRDFVEGVRAILAETGLAPRCLELELTETFLMEDAKSTAAVLQDLKDMGVQQGVETREQLAFLQEQSCPEAQGYFFSQPVAAGDFARLLGSGAVEPALAGWTTYS